MSSDSEAGIYQEKRSDLNTLFVGSGERYELPDAVMLGVDEQKKEVIKMKYLVAATAVFLAVTTSAQATSGPGCLRIVNVASWDVLNMRAGPSASSRIVATIDPQNYGVLKLNGTCVPKNVAWGSRWCPIINFDGDGSRRGWVKTRFVRDSECP